MHDDFAQLTHDWFKRAFVYTGSIGDFRYRFATDKDAGLIHAAIYSVYCYEKATDRLGQDFAWSDTGVEELKSWLQKHLEQFSATGKIESI